MIREVGVVALRLPALAHRLGHEGPGAAYDLVTLAEATGGALAFDAVVWVVEDAGTAVRAALDALAAHPHAAAAVGAGLCLVAGGHPVGLEALRVRAMLAAARVGECMVTPAVFAAVELPEGVGAHPAPGPVAESVGHEVHVLRDYR